MSIAKNITQKVKGKVQEVEGEIDEHSGRPIAGIVKKIKGRYNDKSADAKMDVERGRRIGSQISNSK